MTNYQQPGSVPHQARQLQLLVRCLTTVGLLVVGVGLGACVTIPGKNHTSYHLIIGFGVVAVSDPEQTALVATDVHSLGVMVSD